MSGRWLPQLGKTELDPAGEPLSAGPLGTQEGQGQVDALDLTVPSLCPGPLAADEQVGFDLVEPGQHRGGNLKDRAANTGMLVRARGAIWAAAGAEFHLPLVEVFFELGPLRVAWRPVFHGRAQLAPPVEKPLVVADEILVEDRDITAGCLQGQVPEQGGADVDGQAVVDQFGGEDPAEVVGAERQPRELWPGLGQGEAGALK